MLSIEDVQTGSNVVHKNTGLRYAVVDVSKEEVLLSPESDDGMQDLMVPVTLFCEEFIGTDRYAAPRRPRARGRRPAAVRAASRPAVSARA